MLSKEIQQSQNSKQKFFYGYVIVVAALCITTMMYGTRLSFGVFFKPVLNDFGWSRALTSGALSLSVVIQGLSAMVMGNLTDRLGPRKVMTICGGLLGVGYLLMSQINQVWQLYVLYGVIIGVGMSGVFAPLMSTVARWFVKKRGMMTGIAMTGIGVGTVIVPPIANYLISIYDWRISYILVGAIALVIVVAIAQLLKRDPSQMGQVAYGENEGREQYTNKNEKGVSLKVATHVGRFWVAFGMFVCLGVCLVGWQAHIIPYATDLGISAASAANILAALGVGHLAGGIVLGNASDKFGNRRAFVISFILMLVSLIGLLLLKNVWMLYLLAIVFGFGGGAAATLMSPLVAELFGLSSHGLILGMMSFSFTLGAALGPFLDGYTFDITGSYQLAFLISIIFSIVGLILSFTIRPIKNLN